MGLHTHLKVFNREMFLSNGMMGVGREGAETKEKVICPTWAFILSADTKPDNVAVAKRHLLTGIMYEFSFRDSASK